MFEALENIVFTSKWPSLKAKVGKTKKSKFGRIDSCKFVVTYFASMARAKTPAASGAAAEVPE